MWTLVIIIPVAIVLYLLLRKWTPIAEKHDIHTSRMDTEKDSEPNNVCIHIRAVVSAVLIGVLGFVVFFAFGSISGRGMIAVIAALIFYLFGGVFLTRKYPASKWYGGAIINIPIWTFFKFWAETGQFKIFFWALIGSLVSSYTGTLIGLWLVKRNIVFQRRMKVLLFGVPLFFVVLLAYILNLPKPIPSDKNIFVGLWKSGSGFELEIMSDGTATITQNINDRGSDYESLNIKVAPSRISNANVEFRGDSLISVARPGYYAREYRIDKYPCLDNDQYKMILNGVTLVKE